MPTPGTGGTAGLGTALRSQDLSHEQAAPAQGAGEESCSHLQVRDAVAFPQRNLKHFQTADVCCQPCQTLFPTASYPHQQRVAPGRL